MNLKIEFVDSAEFSDQGIASSLGEGELEAIIELYKLAQQGMPEDEEGLARILDELSSSEQYTFVARDEDGEIAGLTSYYLPEGVDYAYLSVIAVDPDLQGMREVGPFMMSRLTELAADVGRQSIEFKVENKRAESFYRRLGAVPLSGNRMRI